MHSEAARQLCALSDKYTPTLSGIMACYLSNTQSPLAPNRPAAAAAETCVVILPFLF